MCLCRSTLEEAFQFDWSYETVVRRAKPRDELFQHFAEFLDLVQQAGRGMREKSAHLG